MNDLDPKTKSDLWYIIGYLEGIAETHIRSNSNAIYEALQKPIAMLKEIAPLPGEIKE